MESQPQKLSIRRPLKSLAIWSGFVHLLARFYMDYHKALLRAARRKFRRSVDIDVQQSKQGTLWALHWGTVGKNKLHDPLKRIKPRARISDLTDDEIERLRGPRGQEPWRVTTLLDIAYDKNVRVELELKVFVPAATLRWLLSRQKTARMNRNGKLQFKTLASMRKPIRKLRAAKDAGGVTILSFTGYRGRGISKAKAWPVTDYVRGKAHWI